MYSSETSEMDQHDQHSSVSTTNERVRRKIRRNAPMRKMVLQDRLQEVLVFELHMDGNREYQTMTLRKLYNYVMKAITTRVVNDGCLFNYEATLNWINGGISDSTLTTSSKATPTTAPCSPPSEETPPPFSLLEKSEGEELEIPQKPEKLSVAEGIGSKKEAQQPSSRKLSSTNSSGQQSLSVAEPSGSTYPRSSLLDPGARRQTRQRVSFLSEITTNSSTPTASEKSHGSADPVPDSADRRQRQQIQPLQKPHDQHGGVTYRERLGGYLHPRDMRRLVTPFSPTNEPELIVRRHVMLLNFDPLRAVVLRDRVLVLVPDGADSILIGIEKRVRGGVTEMANQVFGDSTYDSETMCSSDSYPESSIAMSSLAGGKIAFSSKEETGKGASRFDSGGKRYHENQEAETESDDDSGEVDDEIDDELDDIDTKKWIDMPFELQSVDAILQTVSLMLSDDANKLRQKVLVAMAALRGDARSSIPGDHAQERLRILKDDVKEMRARVQGFVRALNLVLDEDEDMALMNLSRLITHPDRFIQPVSDDILHEESDEPELILEAYLQQALSIVNALELLTGQVATTEELVNMKLDTIRNRLLYVNTILSLLSLCVAAASLVGSIFGMNLTNFLEDDENAFKQVVLGTCFGALGLLLLLILVLWRSGTLPSVQ